jgi:hypothetical protein
VLAAELEAAGYDVGPLIPHAHAIAAAIQADSERQHLRGTLTTGCSS